MKDRINTDDFGPRPRPDEGSEEERRERIRRDNDERMRQAVGDERWSEETRETQPSETADQQ